MTAKELLLQRVGALSEAEAERALLALDSSVEDSSGEDEMAALPEGWGETLTGAMPNVVAAVRRSRESR